MSAVGKLPGGWLKNAPVSSQYNFENWGSQGAYFLIIGFFTWGLCLGLYRGICCERILY